MHLLSEKDRSTVVNALRIATEAYRLDAEKVGIPMLTEQFER